jgi:hypothetical protein
MSAQKAIPADEEARIDGAIMEVLLDVDDQRPWLVADLAREIGDPIEAADGLVRLVRAGLVHRLDDGFVLPSRAAVRAVEIIPNELR